MNKGLTDLTERCNNDMKVIAEAVFTAGETIKTMPRNFEVKEGEGHRSGTTEGDHLAQQIIVNAVISQIPNARILCEEESVHPAVLPKNNPDGIFDGTTVIIDPVDSTLHYGEDTGGWAVTAGLMHNSTLVGSAVYAPGINDGFMLVSEAGMGVSILEWGGKVTHNVSDENREPKKSVVRLGVDALLYPNLVAVVPTIATNVKGVLTTGSGVLGLALLACGRVQAVIQTPQKAWDWATIFNAVIQGGSQFYFFRIIENGNLEEVGHYDYASFCFTPKQNRLGFVAGKPNFAEKLLALIPKRDWSRLNPDTVSGSW